MSKSARIEALEARVALLEKKLTALSLETGKGARAYYRQESRFQQPQRRFGFGWLF